jgi:hypothetical protein
MKMKLTHMTAYNKGVVDGWMISTIGLIILVLGSGSLAIWAYMNYNEAKTDIDGKVALAQAEAKKEQAEEDEAKFAEREKEPRREFIGPDEYGRLSFTYPKTWSVYIAKDARRGGDYEAYLHPVQVPSLENQSAQQVALRLQILNRDYNDYLKDYEGLTKDGKLRSSTVSVNGENGIRFDGDFSEDIRGAAVVFKIRDKTAVLRTDADTFKPDFDALIKTLTFIK